MKKRLTLSLITSVILSLLVVSVALAGSGWDMGQLETTPPIGEVNFFAWLDKPANIRAEGMPEQILTEENFNSNQGQGGYQETSPGVLSWLLKVENFDIDSHLDPVSMIFGGLGASSGKLWFYDFVWDQLSEPVTDHGLVPLSTQSEACPAVTSITRNTSTASVSFNHLPNSTYHVYRATQPSGAGNGLSSGRYNYLKTVPTNSSGFGSFTDVFAGESWYVIIRANATTNELVGCHSEPAFPTYSEVISFEAVYHASLAEVELTWETDSEEEILGFNLFRSTTENKQDGIQLNTTLIPAKNLGQSVGASYSYLDDSVAEGETYYYWLEVAGTDDSRSQVGPREVTTSEDFYYYLPVFFK